GRVVAHPVPGDVQRHTGGYAGEPVHRGGVLDLLLRGAWNPLLGEDFEPGPGVAEGPRGGLDLLRAQGLLNGRQIRHVDHFSLSGAMTALCCSSWSCRWKTSSSSRNDSSGGRPSMPVKNCAISACHRVLTSRAAIAAWAACR